MGEGARAPALAIAAMACLAVAAWCAHHGYIGVSHDGVLYAFQAIAGDQRAWLTDDLYLRYGSQDTYTVFSPVYRAAIAAFGFEGGAMALVLAGQAVWAAAALAVLWSLFGRDEPILFLVAAVLVAAADPHYGVIGALIYAEGFATPRLWAEALSLIALWGLLERRWLVAAAAFALALALHPIMALAAAAFIYFCLAAMNGRWLLLLPPALALLGAGIALGIGPLKNALASFDADWLAIVRLRSPQLFTDGWPFGAWLSIYARVLVLATAAALSEGLLKRAFLAGIAAFVVGVAATWFGADLLGNILIVQIQPWRIFWPAHALTVVALAVILIRAPERSAAGRPAVAVGAAALVLTFAALDITPAAHVGAVAAALAVLALALTRRLTGRGAAALRWLLAALALGGFGLAARYAGLSLSHGAALLDEGMRAAGVSPVWVSTLPVAAALGAVLLAVARRAALWRVAAPAALVLAVAGLSVWDKRTAWTVHVEENFGTLGDGALAAPEDGIVLWQGHSAAFSVWFGLNRKTYLSWPQGAGVVFNRGTAIEYARRSRLVETVDDSATGRSFSRRLLARPAPTLADMRALCADEAAPALFVLTAPVEGVAGRTWRASAPDARLYSRDPGAEAGDWATREVELIEEYHVYDCGDFAG